MEEVPLSRLNQPFYSHGNLPESHLIFFIFVVAVTKASVNLTHAVRAHLAHKWPHGMFFVLLHAYVCVCVLQLERRPCGS